ncbi:hypothetical protein CXG81DRAFT_23534 [Caulochytrium protostelioides]|uniref:Uncharacterized protein n=1 Tax=Caulochytrium protostelioides TaxID=1555241 RepID=A0A4P9XF66_9FUNG|nr:hypothetical protein CXG81DRAFT_23534 [Caulochytrium protostelioides]|eukprot:RKP03841.1 hypothetical protein CXG81DRAFT_23534 [Caulochytrium protostelioides]
MGRHLVDAAAVQTRHCLEALHQLEPADLKGVLEQLFSRMTVSNKEGVLALLWSSLSPREQAAFDFTTLSDTKWNDAAVIRALSPALTPADGAADGVDLAGMDGAAGFARLPESAFRPPRFSPRVLESEILNVLLTSLGRGLTRRQQAQQQAQQQQQQQQREGSTGSTTNESPISFARQGL